jgi:hypothetical protein
MSGTSCSGSWRVPRANAILSAVPSSSGPQPRREHRRHDVADGDVGGYRFLNPHPGLLHRAQPLGGAHRPGIRRREVGGGRRSSQGVRSRWRATRDRLEPLRVVTFLSRWPACPSGAASNCGLPRLFAIRARLEPTTLSEVVSMPPRLEWWIGGCKLLILGRWSRRSDSNRRPADYESAALPTELRRPGVRPSARA